MPPTADDRCQRAVARFNEANSRDSHQEFINGVGYPREAVYAQRLADWVLKLAPDASEALQLASWCQHLCRWEIPRSRYEMSRAGYLLWRNELKAFHARRAGEILQEAGYAPEMIQEVQALNLKRNFPADPESRVLEDALCLVFLEHQLADLAAKTELAKLLTILRKSWVKMTPAAREHALHLPLAEREKQLLQRALAAK